MFSVRRGLVVFVVVLAGCGGGGPGPTTAPTQVPSMATNAPPIASLDPSTSDAGVVAWVTVSNDARGGRDGTYEIAGRGADGSECALDPEGDEFTLVAWKDDAPDGQLLRLSVTIPQAQLSAGGGSRTTDGRVSFDFVSQSGFGTLYTGDARGDNEGRSSIAASRPYGQRLFDFEGMTYDGVAFAGQAACRVGLV